MLNFCCCALAAKHHVSSVSKIKNKIVSEKKTQEALKVAVSRKDELYLFLFVLV